MVEEINCKWKISVDFGEWKEDEAWKITEVHKYRDHKINLPPQNLGATWNDNGEALRRYK